MSAILGGDTTRAVQRPRLLAWPLFTTWALSVILISLGEVSRKKVDAFRQPNFLDLSRAKVYSKIKQLRSKNMYPTLIPIRPPVWVTPDSFSACSYFGNDY